VISYASRTGTQRNLAAMWRAGWRLLVSAAGVHRCEGFPYAIDNGAWTCYQQGIPFDFVAFDQVVSRLGDGSDFIVVPDRVADARTTLRWAAEWLPILDGIGRRRLVAVQDGMVEDDVRPWLGDDVGIFVGGTTDWKVSNLGRWGRLRRRGRVLGARRPRQHQRQDHPVRRRRGSLVRRDHRNAIRSQRAEGRAVARIGAAVRRDADTMRATP